MKLKDIVQIAVLTVIGFAIGMAISMLTGTLGAIALYASAGFAAFAVGPVFVITAKKIKRSPIASITQCPVVALAKPVKERKVSRLSTRKLPKPMIVVTFYLY